jgi:signal transduction histidine kinase
LRHAFNEVLAAHYESAMRAAAEQANASKSAFIANISHELRSPMHAIIGLSDILARDEDATPAAKRQHYATTIRDCGNRLLRLIEDLLDLSRLGSGRMPFHFTAADIAGTIEAAIGETASLAARNQIGIVYERPDTRSICLHDIARMQQVVINLLANAIKFSPSGATVTITHTAPGADPSGADVLLEVADAGTGIPHDEIEAIFETFVQSSRTKTGAGGSGLGLSISRAIVEAHQGRIWAANNRDGGASLFVSLPCRPVARTGAPP